MYKRIIKKIRNVRIGSRIGSRIRNKIGISLGILILITAVTNVYMRFNIKDVGQLSNDLFKGPYEVTSQAVWIERDLQSIRSNVSSEILEENELDYKAQLYDSFDDIDERINIISDTGLVEEQLILNFRNAMSELRKEYENAYEQKDIFSFDLSYNKSVQILQVIYDVAYNQAVVFDRNAQQNVSKVSNISSILNVFSIAVAIIICLYLIKILVGPIEKIHIAVNKLSNSDYDFEIEHKSKDELGLLCESLRRGRDANKEVIMDIVHIMNEFSEGNFKVESKVEYPGELAIIKENFDKITSGLSETITQIDSASQEVEIASQQGAESSQILAHGATEQASEIEELSATVIDMSNKINQTTQEAKKANSLMMDSSSEVEKGNEKMKQMVFAINEISFASNEINKIIKTIDDIAFQTNILALNAAVEAARAGAHGKGFAVVADEVRNLASKSAEAAKSTNDLIENSMKSVENGTSIVNDTAKSFESIINTTDKVTSIVDDITIACEEEANAISQIKVSVEQISNVVQTNSAVSEESAASAQELNAQAQMLKSLISKFKTK